MSSSDPDTPRPFNRTLLSISLSEDTFRTVDPDWLIELFMTSVPHGPLPTEPLEIDVYNTRASLPVSRSARTFQNQ